jgi:4-diphosphocytidyl-2-C-methyl-D-erythritol kinase
MGSARFPAFAKINLGLRILGSRPDGYHEIRTVYQSISLRDRLDVSLATRPGAIEVLAGAPGVPDGPDNLVYKACERWREARRTKRRIRVALRKEIPPGSGLGGASSDAAATIVALERLSGDRLPLAARLEIAAELGSDVPFFLLGGRALGCGRGEEVYPLPDLAPRRCLVILPGFSQSTREAYAAIDSQLTAEQPSRNIYSFGKWPQFPWDDWEAAENDFESVVFAKWPELSELKRQLLRAGAEMASLTGSGTAVYAIFPSARKLAFARDLLPKKWRSFAGRTLSRSELRAPQGSVA